jgi:hypothetical protein
MPGKAFQTLVREKDSTKGFALLEPLLSQAELVKLVLEKDARLSCVWIPKTACGRSPDTFEFHEVDRANINDHFPDTKQYLAEVDGALNKPMGNREHRRFFSVLDRETSSELLGVTRPKAKEEIETFVGQVSTVLRAKLPRRVHAAGNRPLLNGMKNELNRLARHFMNIVHQEYPGDLGARGWERAIELFATGRLRMQLQPSFAWVCQPNSAYYFLFGEFALSACELLRRGLLTDERWTQNFALGLANVTVRTQPLYALAYGKRAEGLAVDKRGAAAYRSYDYDEDRATKAYEALAQREKDFSGARFEDLCAQSAEHISRFLPGWPGVRRLVGVP